jgi:hypothetical protein
MRVGVLATLAVLALIALPLTAAAGPAADTDGDGTFDALDSCINVANPAPVDCDTDSDGYGNQCDGDFDNGGTTTPGDFTLLWIPDFVNGGSDSGIGSDMDCGGTVTPGDFTQLWIPNFTGGGLPGPSGLSCAGTVPCP